VAGSMVLSLPTPAATQTAHRQLLTRLLWDDMHLPHEESPHGVPWGFSWARKPRLDMGNNPKGFRALLGWGQLYRCSGDRNGVLPPVELRDLNTWVLESATRRWVRIQKSRGVEGAAYREDYAQNEAIPAQTVLGSTGGTIVTMTPNRNFHFWGSSGRVQISAPPMGVIVTVRARLAPASNRTGRHECLILGAGADYWQSTTAMWTSGESTVRNTGIGRFKRVGWGWRMYTMSTVPRALLSRYPVPIAVPSDELF
jgi:hypothetical protein